MVRIKFTPKQKIQIILESIKTAYVQQICAASTPPRRHSIPGVGIPSSGRNALGGGVAPTIICWPI